MAKIVAVDQDCCIGCEVCAQLCPQVFCMSGDEDGHDHDHSAHKSTVHNPQGASEAQIEVAMDACPAACIYWQS